MMVVKDVEELAEAIAWLVESGNYDPLEIAEYLTTHGPTLLLDPSDTDLREEVAKNMFEVYSIGLPWEKAPFHVQEVWRESAWTAIETLRKLP
jgi:hypothetical protein